MSAGRVLLQDLAELLHRQVYPARWKVVEKRPASNAFVPTPNDEGQLSVARDSKASQQVAYERFVARGRDSKGTWSVTVGECDGLKLPAYEDPLPDDDSHALIDFESRPLKEIEGCAKVMWRYAMARKCYRPAESGEGG